MEDGQYLTSRPPRKLHCVVLAEEEPIHQWNIIESPEIGPHKKSQVMFDKGTKVKVIQWKKQSFQKMVLKQLDTHMQKRESRHRPYTHGSQT